MGLKSIVRKRERSAERRPPHGERRPLQCRRSSPLPPHAGREQLGQNARLRLAAVARLDGSDRWGGMDRWVRSSTCDTSTSRI